MSAWRSLVAASVIAAACAGPLHATDAPASRDSARHLVPAALVWREAPPPMPAGTKIAVLEGDPKKPGMFTFRLHFPPNISVPPHWHPREERVTVISGVVHLGYGRAFDTTRSAPYPAGSFYLNPPENRHFIWTADEGAILQFTGTGPWEARFEQH